MAKIKVAVTLDRNVLQAIDKEVADGLYLSRSQAVQEALSLLLQHGLRNESLLAALALLDPEEEVALAEEWLKGEPW